MNEIDKKIFELYEILKANRLVFTKQDFCDYIEIDRNTMYMVQKKGRHFSVKTIYSICLKFKINANWLIYNVGDVFLKKVEALEVANSKA